MDDDEIFMKDEIDRIGSKLLLKPCPFCGGEARLVDGNGGFWVECTQCDILQYEENIKDEVIYAWNRRY